MTTGGALNLAAPSASSVSTSIPPEASFSARMTELPGPEAENRFDDPFNVLARETVGMLIRYSHSPALAHSFDDCTR
jgi:hypothetical protein